MSCDNSYIFPQGVQMKRSLNIGIALIAMLLLLGCNFDPPNTAKAVDDNATVTSGQSVTIDVLANDEDSSGVHNPTKWIRSATQPTHGTVVVDKNLTIIYTADAGFVGKDRFTYTLGIHSMTDEANVTVTVIPAPLPPVALPQSDAGEDKEVVAGKSVELNGTCFVTAGTIKSCIWYEGSRKLPDQEALRGGTSISANQQKIRLMYAPATPGIHTLRLVAIDGNNHQAEDETKVRALDPKTIPHDKVFFEWNDGTHGSEPWVSNGTVVETKMLKDIAIDGNNSSPEFSNVVINGYTFFAATSGDKYDRELWRTNGTTDGTVQVVDIAKEPGHGSHPRNLCKIESTLYFLALDGNTSDSNNWDGNKSLWKSTGEIGNATKVENFGDFSSSGYTAPGYLRAVGSKLLFQKDYDDGNGANWNPWVSDGMNQAVRVAGDTFKGAYDSFSWNGAVYQEKYYTSANDGAIGDEVWMWDYANNTATLLIDINDDGTKGSSPNSFIVTGGKLFFTATKARGAGDSEEYDRSLWVTDGTNTEVVKDDNATPSTNRDRFSDMTAMGDTLYFVYLEVDNSGNTIGRGTLWRSEGTETSTIPVKEINVTSSTLKATDDTLFFQVEGDESTGGLWISDGTETGTHRVKAFGPNVYWYDSFVKDGLYYFILDDADNGKRELWRSDGTALGTLKLLATDHAPG